MLELTLVSEAVTSRVDDVPDAVCTEIKDFSILLFESFPLPLSKKLRPCLVTDGALHLSLSMSLRKHQLRHFS